MPGPKRPALELLAALLLYGGLLVAAAATDRALRPDGMLKLCINLAPMIGAFAVAGAVMRALWRMDEMHRRIHLDAIALAFLGTALLTFGWGFAEGAGLPQLRAFAIWPIMAAFWGVGLVVAARRYR